MTEQVVTAEQREQELQLTQAYHDRVASDAKVREERETALRVAELTALSNLDRLMRQEIQDTFNLVFQDEAGDYNIPIRYLTIAERRDVITLIMNLGIAGAEGETEEAADKALEAINAAFDAIAEMTASLVTDPVTAEGIRQGRVSDKTCIHILKTALKRTVALEETGASFRLN